MRRFAGAALVGHVVRPLVPVPVPQPLLAARVGIPVGLAARRGRWGAGLRVGRRRAGARSGAADRRGRGWLRLLLRRLGVAAAPRPLAGAGAPTDPPPPARAAPPPP